MVLRDEGAYRGGRRIGSGAQLLGDDGRSTQADVTQAFVLLHGDETEAWGDAGYQGVDKHPRRTGVAASLLAGGDECRASYLVSERHLGAEAVSTTQGIITGSRASVRA